MKNKRDLFAWNKGIQQLQELKKEEIFDSTFQEGVDKIIPEDFNLNFQEAIDMIVNNKGISICCELLRGGLYVKLDSQETVIVMEGSHDFGPLLVTKNLLLAKWKIFKSLSSEDFLISKLGSVSLDKEYPGNIIIKDSEGYTVMYNRKNHYLAVDYDHIWSVLEKQYCMDYTEIKEFITNMMLKHLNWRPETPMP